MREPGHGTRWSRPSIGRISGLIPTSPATLLHEIGGLIYSNLVRTNKDLEVEGELAERWDVSKDELTITFFCGRGSSGTTGKRSRAEDVDFTYRYMIDPKTQPPTRNHSDRSGAPRRDRYTYR